MGRRRGTDFLDKLTKMALFQATCDPEPCPLLWMNPSKAVGQSRFRETFSMRIVLDHLRPFLKTESGRLVTALSLWRYMCHSSNHNVSDKVAGVGGNRIAPVETIDAHLLFLTSHTLPIPCMTLGRAAISVYVLLNLVAQSAAVTFHQDEGLRQEAAFFRHYGVQFPRL